MYILKVELYGILMNCSHFLNVYLKILAISYAVGATLHFADVAGLRLNFAEMNLIWKLWTIYLLLGDTFAAIGLWLNKTFGQMLFITIAISQLVAYLGFSDIFGRQGLLIGFHLVTLSIYGGLKLAGSK